MCICCACFQRHSKAPPLTDKSLASKPPRGCSAVPEINLAQVRCCPPGTTVATARATWTATAVVAATDAPAVAAEVSDAATASQVLAATLTPTSTGTPDQRQYSSSSSCNQIIRASYNKAAPALISCADSQRLTSCQCSYCPVSSKTSHTSCLLLSLTVCGEQIVTFIYDSDQLAALAVRPK